MKSDQLYLFELNITIMVSKYTLIAVVAIAFVWAYLAGIDKHENISPIKVKKHGRRAYSFFKYGLIRIAHAIMNTLNIKEFNDCIKVLSCT